MMKASKNIKIFLKKSKSFLSIYRYIQRIKIRLIRYLDQKRISKFKNVYRKKKLLFKVLDMGYVTRFRAETFESKEPETIKWIESFEPRDTFLDIGANIGIYSLFAAKRAHKVISIEPDALNYALLNLNIRENSLSSQIKAYSIAMNDLEKFSYFNISSYEWGGALNSFDNSIDYKGNRFKPVHIQGVYGVPLDHFLCQINFSPSHIKIDVDGNEFLIIKGSLKTLASNQLKSFLVELDESKKDYKDSINLIESSGLKLKEKIYVTEEGPFSTTANHIFIK